MDHRLVDGKTGIGIDDLVAHIRQRQNRKENNWLSAGDDDHPIARDIDSATARNILGNGLAQLGQSCRRTVVSPSCLEGFDPGFDDVFGRVKIGLTNFEMNDVFALAFQSTRLIQYLKGGLGAQSRHPLSQSKFVLRSFLHSGKSCHYISSALCCRFSNNSIPSAGVFALRMMVAYVFAPHRLEAHAQPLYAGTARVAGRGQGNARPDDFESYTCWVAVRCESRIGCAG